MAQAIAHSESLDSRHRILRDATQIRTTEPRQQEYPEAKITTSATPDRHASYHSNYIPEPRIAMIPGFPTPVIPSSRQHRKRHSILRRTMMKICEQDSPPNDSPSAVSMRTDLTFHRSGTGPAGRRAGRVPSLSIRSIHAPVPGSRGWL